jgi:alpha-mannosidase
MPVINFGRYIDFFKYIETLDLPVVDQELNFLFDGCYTSQTRIKKANRISEAALFESEAMNTFSHLCGGYEYNAKAFNAAWENVLFNHFHDIIPGSGVLETREHALGLFQQTMAHAGTRKSAAARSISSKINTIGMLPEQDLLKDSIAEGAGVGYGVSIASGAMFGASYGAGEFNYTMANAVSGKKRLFHLFNPTQTVKTASSLITVWDWAGDIGKVKVTDEQGEDVEIEVLDKKALHYWGHDYFRVLVSCEIEPFGYRTILLEEAPVYMPEPWINWERTDKVSEFVLENEFVKAVFNPRDASLISFTDKETGKEYIGESGGTFNYILEDGSKHMSAWIVGRYMSVSPIVENARLTDVKGSLKRSFSFYVSFENSKLEVTVSLDKNSRMLEYRAECVWREFGEKGKVVPQLSFKLPLSYSCDTYMYDTAFGIVKRAEMDYDAPGLSFAFAPNGREGLMFTSADKYGYRCYNDSMSLTLIRSSYDPDEIPECYRHRFAFGIGIIKDSGAKNLIETSACFNHPAITVAAASQEGSLSTSGSFMAVESGDVVISSVKMPEDSGDAIIIRAYDVSGESGDAEFKFFKPVRSAEYIDAHEVAIFGEKPGISGDTVTARVRASGVMALKVTFGEL